jgi:hypothetical protein
MIFSFETYGLSRIRLSLWCFAFGVFATAVSYEAYAQKKEEMSSPTAEMAPMHAAKFFQKQTVEGANGLVIYAVPLLELFRINIKTVTSLKQVACKYTATTDIAQKILEMNELLSAEVDEAQSDRPLGHDFRFGIEYLRGDTIIAGLYFNQSYQKSNIEGIFGTTPIDLSYAVESRILEVVNDHSGYSMTTRNPNHCHQ